jgi:hypothetical protein
MHNNFIDKKRRFINFREMQVENVLPEHFASLYPKFISLLEKYYDFQGEYKSTELLQHLFAARDINETDITLLTFIEDELLLGEEYFKGFGKNETELRAAANFSNILFRAKGTKFAIEWFFRSFYGEDVEVLYPKENIFKVSDLESQLGPNSLRYLTDDKLYQTFAVLIRVGIPISKWKEVFKLFVHPAGMYLGGEVFIQDDVNPNIVTLNDVVNQYISPSYVLSSTQTVDEGDAITITVNGSNLVTGTDAIYWYGQHISTIDSDFGVNHYDGKYGLPGPDSAQYVPINGSTGQFNINTVIDALTNPAEGDETFNVFIRDRSGRALANQTITIGDVVPSYQLSVPNAGNLTEGSGPYTITLVGTNIENGGTTTAKWYIDESQSTLTLKDSDFVDFYDGASVFPNSPATAKTVAISSSTGTFTLSPRVDGISEGLEQAAIKILTVDDIEVGNGVVRIFNTAYSLAVDVPDIVEGNPLVATITSGAYNIGNTVTWTVSGSMFSDARLAEKSGTVTFVSDGSGGAQAIVSTPVTSSDTAQGPVTGFFGVEDTNLNSQIPTAYAQGIQSDAFTVNDAAAVYTITTTPSIATEGDTVTYTVGGTNIPDGTVYFGIANIDTTAADWTTTPPDLDTRQPITISGGTGTFQLTYASNGDQDDETYQTNVYLDGPTNIGSSVASDTVTIVGTGNITTFAISTLTPNENTGGSGFNWNAVVSTNQPDGTYKYWITGDVVAADFLSGYATISSKADVVISGGTGTINLTIADEYDREGTENFQVTVGGLAIGNPAIAISPQIEIQDTTVQSYFIYNYRDDSPTGSNTTSTVTEDENLYIGVTGFNVFGISEQLYVELSGTAASLFDTTQIIVTGPSTTGQRVYATFVADGDNSTIEANRTLNVRVTAGNYFSTGLHTIVLNNEQITVTDPAPTASFTAVDDTPLEGDLVTFNVTTTNTADNTFLYYAPSTAVLFTGSQTSGNTVITAPSGTAAGLVSAGMRAVTRGDGLASEMGIVNSTSGSQIFMSNSASTTDNLKEYVFMQDADWEMYQSYSQAFGSVKITSNAGQFTIDLGEDTSTVDNVPVSIVLKDDWPYNGTTLDTEVITIENTTVNPVEYSPASGADTDDYLPRLSFDWQYNLFSSNQTAGGAVAENKIQFRNDGSIWALGLQAGGGFAGGDLPLNQTTFGPDNATFRPVGTWAPPGVVGSDYQIKVTQGSSYDLDENSVRDGSRTPASNVTDTFSGSTGAWLSLGSTREWAYEIDISSGSGYEYGDQDVQIQIRANGTTINLDDFVWTFRNYCVAEDIGGVF